MEITWTVISREGEREGEGREGEVKNSIGNGEAKELIYMTHGRELRWWGGCRRKGSAGWRGIKGGKWDSCNSIINTIYLKGNDYLYYLFPVPFPPFSSSLPH